MNYHMMYMAMISTYLQNEFAVELVLVLYFSSSVVKVYVCVLIKQKAV